jgi:hypothetical protein
MPAASLSLAAFPIQPITDSKYLDDVPSDKPLTPCISPQYHTPETMLRWGRNGCLTSTEPEPWRDIDNSKPEPLIREVIAAE